MGIKYSANAIVYTGHAVRQMFARHISEDDIVELLSDCEIITEYPDDTPFPSRLVLGFARGRPLHVLFGHDVQTETVYVVTAYEPAPELWENDFKVRKPR